jgi:hypothetical protein
MTGAELFDAVRFYLNRPNQSNTDVAMWVSSATGKLNTLLRDHPRTYREGEYNASAGQTRIPLPYDMLQLRHVRRDNAQLAQFTAGNVEDCSDGFIERGDCLEITAPPAMAAVYRIGYHRALTAPTVSGSVNWVLQFFPDVYLYTTLGEAAVALKDRDNGPVWDKLAQERIGALIAQGWNQNFANSPRIR